MTQDEIIETAQECGLIGMRPHLDGIYSEALVAFYKLAVAKEREACAKVCDEAFEIMMRNQSGLADDLVNIILRHHALAHQNDAAAIRARGDKQ
jgi:hypothetical protein